MKRITDQINELLENKVTLTTSEFSAFLRQLRDIETKQLIKVHKDGKNTILTNENSKDAIKRLFP